MDQQKSISQPKRRETESDKEEDEDVDVGQLAESLKFVGISPNKSDDGKPPASGTSQHLSGGREKGKDELPSNQSSQPSTSEQPGPSGAEGGHDQQDRQNPKIKFLIQVPMWVPVPDKEHPKKNIMSQCQRLLDLLQDTGFNEEDRGHLEDVAIIIGLNGKHDPKLSGILEQLQKIKEKAKLKFEKVSFTWGPGGNIPYNREAVPYSRIREHLKNCEETKKLVRKLRGNDEECLVYFSFVDADTVDFNEVYSSYLQIVDTHVNTHKIPPTVMSTGYEFLEKEFQLASQIDREVRIRTADCFPLGTYYPEPNFCVLLPKAEETLPESFINTHSKAENMESPTLIRQVKKRSDIPFTALFPRGQPIITAVPPGIKLKKGEVTTQCHHDPFIWATSAYTHGELKYEPARGPKRFYNIRAYLMRLLTCDDEEFKKRCGEFSFTGPGVEQLKAAAQAWREYRRTLETGMKKVTEKGERTQPPEE
ncbi:uncharacterized protein LOC134016431 [Osmerus eperlanus]|uniref:uncharacterized protein LOC134016431 n=1 Tax=Osmerus eperlanus TaxID=29151 RepID=UPI002E14A316